VQSPRVGFLVLCRAVVVGTWDLSAWLFERGPPDIRAQVLNRPANPRNGMLALVSNPGGAATTVAVRHLQGIDLDALGDALQRITAAADHRTTVPR
jgi:hypothetical protein